MEAETDINYEKRVKERTTPLENAVNTIVENHVSNLDSIIKMIKSWLKDSTDELTDSEIDIIMLQLPIVLYELTDDQEIVGLQSDVSTQIYKECYNEAYKLARGTINDKQSVAELNALTSKLDSIIFDRSYKIIKQKITMAIEMLNAVKKIQSSRQSRYELDRYRPKY